MMKSIQFVVFSLLFSSAVVGQKYVTKNGHISFHSETPVETIEAHNHQVNSALDLSTGGFVFKVLMKSFEFEKALMQEHFNENYVESDKYPDASFSGSISNIKDLDLSKEGKSEALVSGKLTIHGVTKEINEKGTLENKGGKIYGKSTFQVALKDYDIKVPKAVINNIAGNIDVTVDVVLEPLK